MGFKFHWVLIHNNQSFAPIQLRIIFTEKKNSVHPKVFPRLPVSELFDEFQQKYTSLSKKYNWNKYKGNTPRFLHWHIFYFFYPVRLTLRMKTNSLGRFKMGNVYILSTFWSTWDTSQNFSMLSSWYFMSSTMQNLSRLIQFYF